MAARYFFNLMHRMKKVKKIRIFTSPVKKEADTVQLENYLRYQIEAEFSVFCRVGPALIPMLGSFWDIHDYGHGRQLL